MSSLESNKVVLECLRYRFQSVIFVLPPRIPRVVVQMRPETRQPCATFQRLAKLPQIHIRQRMCYGQSVRAVSAFDRQGIGANQQLLLIAYFTWRTEVGSRRKNTRKRTVFHLQSVKVGEQLQSTSVYFRVIYVMPYLKCEFGSSI